MSAGFLRHAFGVWAGGAPPRPQMPLRSNLTFEFEKAIPQRA